MNTITSPRCPLGHGDNGHEAPVPHPPGTWPPGPSAGLTGWSLLRHMARDMPGALAGWKQTYGSVIHLRIWPEHQVIVADPQLARELLVTHHDALVRWERGIDVFSQAHGHSALTAEGEAWRAKRHALQPAFAPRPTQAFVPTIAQSAAHAFARWPVQAARWPVESALTSLTMDITLRMMFSSAIDADARLAERAVQVISVAGNREFFWPASWPDWMPWKRTKRRALRLLKDLIERHVRARLRAPRETWPDDLLTRLLGLDWPLHAVRDECMTAFLAGHETTAASLTWWAWCMASHPEAQEAARAEVGRVLGGRAPTAADLTGLPYLAQTLQETLRLYPAAPILISRRATRPITLGGWRLPARTLFSIPVQLIQQDARWFPEPQAFRPERFGAEALAPPRGAFLPFGAGPRVCLGQHLAMTEMTVVAAMLLQRLRLRVPAGEAVPCPVMRVTLRPEQPLHLALDHLSLP